MSFRLAIIFLTLLCCAAPCRAGELHGRMARAAKVLGRAAEKGGLAGSGLAVLPFKTSRLLAEQRVNYACAEILSGKFVEGGGFKVVERARLDDLLREQALGAGGVVESETAARLGRLAGARLVVIGSVARLGRAYHISAELVDAETGEILAADISDVDARLFELDAGRLLVPKKDALGLYVAASVVEMEVKDLPPVTTGGETVTPRNAASTCRYYGVGVRYAFSQRWSADLAAIIGATYSGNDIVADSSLGRIYRYDRGLGGVNARLIIDRVFRPSGKLNLRAGAGIISINEGRAAGTNAEIETKNPEVPILRGVVEWKPTPRAALGLSGLFFVGRPVFKGVGRQITMGGLDRFPIREFSFPAFHPELNLSIYF